MSMACCSTVIERLQVWVFVFAFCESVEFQKPILSKNNQVEEAKSTYIFTSQENFFNSYVQCLKSILGQGQMKFM